MTGEFSGHNIDSYTVDLVRIHDELLDDMAAHESDREYMNSLYRVIGRTAAYWNFDIALNKLGGRAMENWSQGIQ